MDTAGRHGWDRVDAWFRGGWWLTGPFVALGLVVLAGPASVNAVLEAAPDAGWSQALVTAIVVLHVAVAYRTVWPTAAFAVLAAAELVLAIAPPLNDLQAGGYPAVLLPSSLAYLLGAHAVSARAARPWPAVALVVGTVGSLVVVVRLWLAGQPLTGTVPGGSLTLLATCLAAVLAAWALGQYGRLRADQVAALAERARIARELDVVAHSLSAMVRQAEGGRYVARSDPDAAAAVLSTIADTGREALTDMRALLGVLREADTAEAEMGTAAPQPTLDELPELVELVERVRASGQPVRLVVTGRPRPLDRASHLAGYRLVQEALANVAKHAGPGAEAEVVLTWSRRGLRLRVTDTGSGGPLQEDGLPERPRSEGGGLRGMRERVELAGGALRTGRLASGGYRVEAQLPTRRTAGKD